MTRTTVSERALVLAPRGRDAALAVSILGEADILAETCASLPALVAELDRGAAVAVVTEEALATADLAPLAAWIGAQEEWSDLPFVLLTSHGGGIERNPAARRYLDVLGNATFVERPFHPTTLISLVRSALRGRRRQYEARSRLEALREGERRYRALFDTIDEGFCVIEFLDGPHGPLGDYLHVEANAAYTRHAGIPDVVGKRLREIVSETEADAWAEIYRKVLVTGEPVRFERELVETGRHLELAAFRVEPLQRRQVAVLFQDVTPRKRAELELRTSEERFRTALQIETVGAIYFGMDGVLTDANDAFLRMAGFSREEVRAGRLSWKSLTPPEWLDFTHRALAELKIYGRTTPYEKEFLRKDGSRWWALFAAKLLPDGTGFEFVVDITDRKRAEARLRELNETLEAQVAARSAERDRLWNLSQDMLARADYRGMMSAVSPAWTQVLGWSETELLTRGYATFMHPDDIPPTLEAIARMAETREPSRFENRIATRDGGWKHIEWTVAPEPDGVNFIAVGRDLTHAKAREAKLEAAQEALRQSQKMEAMGQLTGGVAHDFNNLLTPIVGALDMLQAKGLGSDREQRLISGAAQSAERARVLVQRLLAFARRQPLQPVAVDIARLVTNMADLVASTTGPQIRVVVDAGEDLPPAKADPNQLEMALLNLAVNARDAMPDGGTLRISASAETIGPGSALKVQPGRYVRLSVADTGVGMDEATLARAVEPFFSTKGVGKGTGLGLSMVHGLASQLGGTLTIRSKPGRGTTIEFWLPETDAEPELPLPLHDAEPMQGRGTALLVDDEEFVRLSTAEMLGDLGYRVVEAASAEEALRVIVDGAPVDLVVTDHLMPGMTGTDLARTIRNRRPDLPVLVVSGYAEVDGIASDLPRLTKPFRKDELAAGLSALAPRAG